MSVDADDFVTIVEHTAEMSVTIFPTRNCTAVQEGVSLALHRDPPAQRPPAQRPYRTETPRQRPLWTETPQV